MQIVLEILDIILQVVTWFIIIQIVLSWLIAFNVVSMQNDLVRQLVESLHRITERIVHLEEEADHLHDSGLKALYREHREGNAMGYIVGREIYSHLERVLDRLEDVANEISGIVIDHA